MRNHHGFRNCADQYEKAVYLIDFATVSNSGNVNLSGLPIESIDYTVMFSNS